MVLSEKPLEVMGDNVMQEQAFAHANDVLKNAAPDDPVPGPCADADCRRPEQLSAGREPQRDDRSRILMRLQDLGLT